jgi:hypothetical protein
MSEIIKTIKFATLAHGKQQRKATGMPYIIHPIDVANILVNEANVTDLRVVQAALLHDTVEDTPTTIDDIEARFGKDVAAIVAELTDDKSLSKAARKRLQIEHATTMSFSACRVKMADKISNLRSLIEQPNIEGWDATRIQGYFVWCKKVVAAMPVGYRDGHLMEFLNILFESTFTLGGVKYHCIPKGIDEDAFLEAYLAAFGDKK